MSDTKQEKKMPLHTVIPLESPSLTYAQRGYYQPELANPTDSRVMAVASQIARPRTILRGLKDYQREMENEGLPEDVRKERSKALAIQHCLPVLNQMRRALEMGQIELQKLETKRADAYKPQSTETQTRLNQLRNELAAKDSGERIKYIGEALRSNNTEIIQAIATFPLNESVCPRAYYWQAQRQHETNVMGKEDGFAFEDLKTSMAQLGLAIESFEYDSFLHTRAAEDRSAARFKEILNGNFEVRDE